MTLLFFVDGLMLFALGVATWVQHDDESALLLGRQLPWLSAFALVHSLVQWSYILAPSLRLQAADLLAFIQMGLWPLAGLLLLRFGIGLISESGPLPRWMLLSPLVLIVPALLIGTYALVVTLTEPDAAINTVVWSRYLFYLPGGLLSAAGFWRQARELPLVESAHLRNILRAIAVALFVNAIATGLITPATPYGLGPWLNETVVQAATGLPVEFLRMLSATVVALLVIRGMRIFTLENRRRMDQLNRARSKADEVLRDSEERFRTVFEYAPIGMDVVQANGNPLRANRALLDMLGYSEAELRAMVFADYTHPDDVEESLRLTKALREGEFDEFQMEKRYYTKDGAVVYGRVTVSGVRAPSGEFRYFIAMVEDITEQKQTEAALKQERELRQAMELALEEEARRVAESWLEALVEISRRIARMDSLDSVLLFIVDQARALLNADVVSLGLLDPGGTHLELKYQAISNRSYALRKPVEVKNERLLHFIRSGQAHQFVENGEKVDAGWYCPTVAQAVRAAAVVPLQFDNQIVGGFWLARHMPTAFTEDQLFGLQNIADQVVIALQHATMAAQLQSVATMEERSRLAREMHDSLAQVLGYVGLQMQTLKAYVEQDDCARALSEIENTRQNVKMAQADVRESILSLRTTLAGDTGLIPALEEYVGEFGIQTGIDARLSYRFDGNLALSPLAEVQLVRIVQEAMTNVRKHANASTLRVELQAADRHLLVRVADDGAGFVPGTSATRSFGLDTMRERARSVGGELTVTSTLGQGTAVTLTLPLLYETETREMEVT